MYFVEERRPCSVGIRRLDLTAEKAAEIAATGVYVEEAACDCSGIEHFLGPDFDMEKGYGCPGPALVEPRECCGIPDDVEEIVRPCEYGCCVILYCPRCCVLTGTAWGPVLCPCDKGECTSGHWAPAERPMLPSRMANTREYARRMRARRGRSRR